MQAAHCMPNPWVSLRRDQLIPVNKAVNKKEQLEKGLEEEEKKRRSMQLRKERSLTAIHLCKKLFNVSRNYEIVKETDKTFQKSIFTPDKPKKSRRFLFLNAKEKKNVSPLFPSYHFSAFRDKPYKGTRLGKFSPIGRFRTFGSLFLNYTSNSQCFFSTFFPRNES
jgi:hypothetical protein